MILDGGTGGGGEGPGDGDSGAGSVTISKAEWNIGKERLRVEGDDAPTGADVLVSDADSGDLLGQTVVEENGRWRFEAFNVAVPCRVRAEINGQFGESEVDRAPNCN